MAPRTIAVICSLLALEGATMPVKSGSQTLSAPDAELSEKVGAVLTGFYEQRAPVAQGGKQMPGLKIQVPEKELQALIDKLSTGCEQQFSDILHGRGPAFHNFGHPGTDSSSAGCAQLNGTLCAMEAQVSRQQDSQGRSMSSSTEVEGNGCLPRHCMADSDLQVLAAFMQSKAKSAIPAPGVEVALKVDCSAAGGSNALVGKSQEVSKQQTAKADGEHAAAKASNQTAAEKPAMRGSDKALKNAAASLGGAFSTIVAVIALACAQA